MKAIQERLRLSKLHENAFAHVAPWNANRRGTDVADGMYLMPSNSASFAYYPEPYSNHISSQPYASPRINAMENLVANMENVSLAANFAQGPYQANEHSTSPIAHMFAAAVPGLDIYGPNCHAQDPGGSDSPLYLDAPANVYEGANEAAIQCSPAPSSNTPLHQSAQPIAPLVDRLEQRVYIAQQRIEGTPVGPIYFNGDAGVLQSELDSLVNGDAPAFDRKASIGAKPSVHFGLVQYPRASSQVWIRCGKDGRPITLRKLAERVFTALAKLINNASDEVGSPLRHKGRMDDAKDIVLLRLEHVSKGSMQAVLGVRCAG
ncbi:hypothetical protein C8Q80DRAFT_1173869 [Daedaleopsis nitida]|nr:hypothetical protein C8Q80DRAFT_1173869 [Daedaleopsis nitida]